MTSIPSRFLISKGKLRNLLRKTKAFWILILVVFCILGIIFISPVRFNITGSMPIGMYERLHESSLKRSDIVSVCLPDSIAFEGKNRGFLASGECAQNTKPLLKEVIALPGDTVTVMDSGLCVNQKFYPAPQLLLDHNHVLIHRWTQNKTYHDIKSVWLYGSNDPMHSWDSRYFGGIELKNIEGFYRALWVRHEDLPQELIFQADSASKSSPMNGANSHSRLGRVYFPPYFLQSKKFPDHTHTTSECGQEPYEK